MSRCDADVLVVEDEPELRETLRDLLQLEGFGVRTAGNGREALDLIARDRPCLVLLDLMMPEMDGWQVLERLHGTHDPAVDARQDGCEDCDGEGCGRCDVAVAVVSAAADAESAGARYGCSVVRKPVDVSKLLALVDRHCRRRP